MFHSAPVAQSKSMTKPMRLADGDTEETYKQRGLEQSAGESVGFFERLRMGNIDQPGSEAYNRFGAGRARASEAMARIGAEDDAVRSSIAKDRAAAAARKARDDADFDEMDRQLASGRSVSGVEQASVAEAPPSMAKPSPTRARPRATSSTSGPVRPKAPDESAAETARLRSRPNTIDQSAAETARLSSRPYVRTASPGRTSGQDRILRDVAPQGSIDPKTMLPRR